MLFEVKLKNKYFFLKGGSNEDALAHKAVKFLFEPL